MQLILSALVKMVRYGNILKIGMTSLSFIFQRPQEPKKGAVVSMMFLLSTLYYIYLIVTQIANFNGDVNLLAKCIESFTTFSQVIIKLLPLMLYKNDLGQLINDTKYFWDIDEFPHLLKQNEYTLKISFYIQNIYRITACVTLFIFYLQPIFTRELLMICWIPDYPYAYEILQMGQYVSAAMLVAYMTGFDNIYVAFCTYLVVQFRIINHTIQNIALDDKDYLLKLKTCVEHHGFLLGFATRMMKIYNISLLGQYVLSIGLTCMEMYIFMESFRNPERIILSTSYLSCLMFQMALFCFPATEVQDEAAKLAFYIYNSKWYDGPISSQKNVTFIMMRAQKEFTFTAAGLAEINREAFTVVFKTSMSFFTLMRQMKQK